jgi:hypothetical protein
VLDARGPRAVIGATPGGDELARPIRPDAGSLFGPRGACLLAEAGPLWVSDTGHHRLLGWARTPAGDGATADWVIGQPDMHREGRNAKGEPGAATLNVPTGITACGAGLAVADAWNHRVLIWQSAPRSSRVPADIVLGQTDCHRVEANGGGGVSARTLFWPYGVHWDGRRLWVADTGNRRLLMWEGLPADHGRPADLVLGQSSFDRRDENGGHDADRRSMRWPHAIATWGDGLCLADAGNNRILVWDAVPSHDNQESDRVLGQRDMRAVDHNQSLYWPSAASLHMPYGVAAAGTWCVVADTANSRLLAWESRHAASGAAARALTGQTEFNVKGDNAWLPPTRASLSWPYGISVCGGLAVVADSGNNRVLLWPLAANLHSPEPARSGLPPGGVPVGGAAP